MAKHRNNKSSNTVLIIFTDRKAGGGDEVVIRWSSFVGRKTKIDRRETKVVLMLSRCLALRAISRGYHFNDARADVLRSF